MRALFYVILTFNQKKRTLWKKCDEDPRRVSSYDAPIKNNILHRWHFWACHSLLGLKNSDLKQIRF